MNKFDVGMALVTYFGFLVALTMREGAAAFASRSLGDKSPETASRATLNPLPHIDPFGTVLFPVLMLVSQVPLLFGWAKPFRPDTRYFKKARRDSNLVFMSGPAANLGIALACGLAMRFGGFSVLGGELTQNPTPFFLRSVGVANLVICVFNILPVPNTDGWKLLLNNINYNAAKKLQELAMPINIAFLVLLVLGGLSFLFHPILQVYSSLFGI